MPILFSNLVLSRILILLPCPKLVRNTLKTLSFLSSCVDLSYIIGYVVTMDNWWLLNWFIPSRETYELSPKVSASMTLLLHAQF